MVAGEGFPPVKNFAFEQKYRGTRELIKQRLSVYVPFVQKYRERHLGKSQSPSLSCQSVIYLEHGSDKKIRIQAG